MKRRFSRWMSCWTAALLGLMNLTLPVGAQAPAPTTPTTVQPLPPRRLPPTLSVSNSAFSFSALQPNQRAEWQKQFTLGPGDVLSVWMFGQLEADRREIIVGPDGRISFMQAVDIKAAGLTIDQLRASLDESLSKYYRAPRVVISPLSYRSKKYYLLGKVVTRGVYLLDRPVTIIEAVARAHGIETGLINNNQMTDLADFQRSFLVRNGQQVPVNFERLFLQGDLSQNIPLEPEDYLYFAGAALKEIYVLGQVQNPGAVPYTENATVVSVIAERGGYTQRAYKSKVVVVRGSLTNPRAFAVDTWAALDARGPDFKLQPKDIVFVHHRPFIYVEDLADLAATAFIQSAISSWTTINFTPMIKDRVLPNL